MPDIVKDEIVVFPPGIRPLVFSEKRTYITLEEPEPQHLVVTFEDGRVQHVPLAEIGIVVPVPPETPRHM